jgi:hypothetical protein
VLEHLHLFGCDGVVVLSSVFTSNWLLVLKTRGFLTILELVELHILLDLNSYIYPFSYQCCTELKKKVEILKYI